MPHVRGVIGIDLHVIVDRHTQVFGSASDLALRFNEELLVGTTEEPKDLGLLVRIALDFWQ